MIVESDKLTTEKAKHRLAKEINRVIDEEVSPNGAHLFRKKICPQITSSGRCSLTTVESAASLS